MSAKRIFLLTLLLAAAAAVALIAYMRQSAPIIAVQSPPPHCESYADQGKLVGPGMTPAQVEDFELREAKRLGIALDAPFGGENDTWVAFKNEFEPGDRILKYSGHYSGGYALVRGNCVLDTFITSLN